MWKIRIVFVTYAPAVDMVGRWAMQPLLVPWCG
jgi:hypothetical protein